MKLVVGLGNIGDEYADTPHNAGFGVVDELSRQAECALKRSLRFRVLSCKMDMAGEEVMLVKPLTYMNASGPAVASVMGYRKLTIADLLVVVDDADIELGRIRIRKNGSSGGHKGIDSIIGSLGSQDFARIRIGVGRSGNDGRGLIGHVLKPFRGEELKLFGKVINGTAAAVTDIYRNGIDAAMNKYNGMVMAA